MNTRAYLAQVKSAQNQTNHSFQTAIKKHVADAFREVEIENRSKDPNTGISIVLVDENLTVSEPSPSQKVNNKKQRKPIIRKPIDEEE